MRSAPFGAWTMQSGALEMEGKLDPLAGDAAAFSAAGAPDVTRAQGHSASSTAASTVTSASTMAPAAASAAATAAAPAATPFHGHAVYPPTGQVANAGMYPDVLIRLRDGRIFPINYDVQRVLTLAKLQELINISPTSEAFISNLGFAVSNIGQQLEAIGKDTGTTARYAAGGAALAALLSAMGLPALAVAGGIPALGVALAASRSVGYLYNQARGLAGTAISGVKQALSKPFLDTSAVPGPVYTGPGYGYYPGSIPPPNGPYPPGSYPPGSYGAAPSMYGRPQYYAPPYGGGGSQPVFYGGRASSRSGRRLQAAETHPATWPPTKVPAAATRSRTAPSTATATAAAGGPRVLVSRPQSKAAVGRKSRPTPRSKPRSRRGVAEGVVAIRQSVLRQARSRGRPQSSRPKPRPGYMTGK
jgi:hypothetical protein